MKTRYGLYTVVCDCIDALLTGCKKNESFYNGPWIATKHLFTQLNACT